MTQPAPTDEQNQWRLACDGIVQAAGGLMTYASSNHHTDLYRAAFQVVCAAYVLDGSSPHGSDPQRTSGLRDLNGHLDGVNNSLSDSASRAAAQTNVDLVSRHVGILNALDAAGTAQASTGMWRLLRSLTGSSAASIGSSVRPPSEAHSTSRTDARPPRPQHPSALPRSR